jgi:4-hydroxythreonine-4-phosphate dehydrogenase
MGEPAGIGPDIILKAWRELRERGNSAFLVIGDAALLRERAQSIGVDIDIHKISTAEQTDPCFADALPVLDRPVARMPTPGRIAPENSGDVARYIAEAVDLCLAGDCAGVVTCPIQKETLYGAGFGFPGHTEYLADLARRAGHPSVPVMMLVGGGLRTVPVTIHISLKDVPGCLTTALIVEQAQIVASGLRAYFGVPDPRIGIVGLNPHAGEGGTIGEEETTIIRPAIEMLLATGLKVTGPIPGDTAFHAEARVQYDVIMCMYHDQALIPVKTLDFHGGVNVTLGLPFIRTSPDHGTALALAGTGAANPGSLLAAMDLANRMAAHAGRA